MEYKPNAGQDDTGREYAPFLEAPVPDLCPRRLWQGPQRQSIMLESCQM